MTQMCVDCSGGFEHEKEKDQEWVEHAARCAPMSRGKASSRN